MDCAACQILDRYAQTGLFMQPVECVFCKNIIDNETESDREQENAHQPENHQEIVSQNLPPEMEVLMNEGMVKIKNHLYSCYFTCTVWYSINFINHKKIIPIEMTMTDYHPWRYFPGLVKNLI